MSDDEPHEYPKPTIESIAIEMLRCATVHPPGEVLFGNVTAVGVLLVAASVIDTCPSCGSTSWVNIDCQLCHTVMLCQTKFATGTYGPVPSIGSERVCPGCSRLDGEHTFGATCTLREDQNGP